MVDSATHIAPETRQASPAAIEASATLNAPPAEVDIVREEQSKRGPRKRMPRKRAVPVEQHRKTSRPVFKQKLTVYTVEAQRVMDRNFARTAYALFSIDVILRIIGEQTDKRSEIDALEKTVQGHISRLSDSIETEIAKSEKLMEDNGIADLPDYTNPVEYNIDITSPQVAVFASLIRKLDRFMILTDALWMNAVLSNLQRAEGHYHWQQRVFKLAGRIIGIELFARSAARKTDQEKEISAAAPEMTMDIDEEVEKASKETITSEV